jgi:enoyl-CoA hydratase
VTVRYDIIDRVAVITIDRQERRNAIDNTTAGALLAAWRRFDADDTADVAILYGAGGTFSAGADLKTFDLVDRPEGWLGFTRMEVTKPTIAAVEGHCVAGGLEMALWCDIRVSGISAVFGCLERRFGVPLVDGGTQRLPRIVGRGIALEMILTGRAVDAEEAFDIGLVNLVVEDGRSLEAAIKLARTIAGFPQATVRSDRRALIEGADLPVEQGLQVERRYGSRVLDDARAGAALFAEGAGRSGRPVEHPRGTKPRPAWTTSGTPVLADGAVDIDIDGIRAPAHVALPKDGAGPGVLVLHDRWGFDSFVRSVVDRLGEAGYVAVGVGITEPVTPGNAEEADKRVADLDPKRVIRVVTEASRMVGALPAAGSRLAVLGFGMGGGLAMWLATAEPPVRACVAYAPTGPWPGLQPDFAATRAAFIGHYGAFDDRASPHTAYQLEIRLRELGVDATFETYRRAGAEFYRNTDSSRFDPLATEQAWARTITFLKRTL